jgi:hypothetical protein
MSTFLDYTTGAWSTQLGKRLGMRRLDTIDAGGERRKLPADRDPLREEGKEGIER